MVADPKIFVASSTEAHEIDRSVREILERLGANILPWRDAFVPGDYALDSLLQVAATVDAALLIASPDDRTWYRGTSRMAPRDNILFELGVFISRLGRRRTAIVLAPYQDKEPALPTDLAGITVIAYDRERLSLVETQIQRWLSYLSNLVSHPSSVLQKTIASVQHRLIQVPALWHESIERFVLDSFRQRAVDACRGEFVLKPNEFYYELYREMDAVDEASEIVAVSTLSSLIWSTDSEQMDYRRKNLAAARRGAKIRRLFARPSSEDKQFRSVVAEQIEAGIEVRQAPRAVLAQEHALEDVVIFRNLKQDSFTAYVARPAFDDATTIRAATLQLDDEWCRAQLKIFDRAWNRAKPFDLRVSRYPTESIKGAPGPGLPEHHIDREVISCEDAASARGVPLSNELKTLILKTSRGLVAVHLRGDRQLNLRAVKNATECAQAYLASSEVLTELELTAGTVSAVREPVWNLRHLVSRSLLDLEYVTTNNGTLKGYYRFQPTLLLQAKHVFLGDFEME